MLELIIRQVNNYFVTRKSDYHIGSFKVSSGKIENADFLKDEQYFRIKGSVFNDGIYKNSVTENGDFSKTLNDLKEEEFNGEVWAMSIPDDFLTLAFKISKWCETNQEEIENPYQSESFGGYSYSKKADADGNLTWQSIFKSDLKAWNKL